MKNRADIEKAIYEHESGKKIIPASLSLSELKKADADLIDKSVRKLKEIFNHIILDSAAGLGEEATIAIKSCDEVIIVTNPNILAVTDSLKTIKLANKLKKPIKGFILTRVKGEKTEMPLQNIKDMLEVPLIGIVPEDNSIDESLMKRNAVIYTKPKSKASKAYMDIAAKLLGKKKIPESLFDRFLAVLGLR